MHVTSHLSLNLEPDAEYWLVVKGWIYHPLLVTDLITGGSYQQRQPQLEQLLFVYAIKINCML